MNGNVEKSSKSSQQRLIVGIIGIVIVDAVHSLRTSECDVDGLRRRSMVSFRVVIEKRKKHSWSFVACYATDSLRVSCQRG